MLIFHSTEILREKATEKPDRSCLKRPKSLNI